MNKNITSVLLHCFVNDGYQSVTHFLHDFDEQMYKQLSHLYCVSISHNKGNEKSIVGLFFIKTDSHHDEHDFIDVLRGVLTICDKMEKFNTEEYSFLPTRLGVVGDEAISENEMLSFIGQQLVRHGVGGSS